MKRTAISLAAAAALLSGHAAAQTSVTLYGVIDAPIEYVNRVAAGPQQQGGSRLSMPTNGGLSGSRWGMRGTEDLGGGMQALFVLESGFGIDTGIAAQSRAFNRQAYVGIGSQYGKVTFGRQYTSMFEGAVNFSPTRFATLYEPDVFMAGLNYREDNVVKYTNAWGPVSMAAHYSFGVGAPAIGLTPIALPTETPGHASDNAGYGASVTYLDGTLGLTAFYDQWNPALVSGQAGRSRKAGAAASYATGALKVMAGYRWAKMDFGNGATFLRDDYYWIGANYQATTALGFTLGYAYADVKTVTPTATALPTNPANPWQVNFIADYALSKRTDVYLTTAYSHNAGLNFDGTQDSFATGYFQTPGQKGMFGVAVGVRHVF
ncbi:porin [Cupriavidus sp. 2TAF22]|uniref:porin n=1 Tax=unclassified Cupriavidus TaxID=2640874 RepID=UPI003F930B4C